MWVCVWLCVYKACPHIKKLLALGWLSPQDSDGYKAIHSPEWGHPWTHSPGCLGLSGSQLSVYHPRRLELQAQERKV